MPLAATILREEEEEEEEEASRRETRDGKKERKQGLVEILCRAMGLLSSGDTRERVMKYTNRKAGTLQTTHDDTGACR